jgi:hypothetical protein
MLKKIALLVSSLGPVVASSDTIIPSETVTSDDTIIRQDVISDEYSELKDPWLECHIVFEEALWAYHSAWVDLDILNYLAYNKVQKSSENLLEALECLIDTKQHQHAEREKTEAEKEDIDYYKNFANTITGVVQLCKEMEEKLDEAYIDREQKVQDELTAQENIRKRVLKLSEEAGYNEKYHQKILSHVEKNIRVLNDILCRFVG